MQKLSPVILAFLTGCFIYSFTEIAARGFTHWTMTLTGGTALAVLYLMQTHLTNVPMWEKCMIGSLVITSLEFTVGIFDNIIMGWHVWDYSDMPLNILGQICLPFSVLWFFICIPAFFVCSLISRRFEPAK
ncbi:MAG: hypothetical protein ACI4I9_08935 [Porcipelethomonas sp.]